MEKSAVIRPRSFELVPITSPEELNRIEFHRVFKRVAWDFPLFRNYKFSDSDGGPGFQNVRRRFPLFRNVSAFSPTDGALACGLHRFLIIQNGPGFASAG